LRQAAVGIESLEGRVFLDGASPAAAIASTGPLQVDRVYVDGTAWAPAFRQYMGQFLAERGLSSAYGIDLRAQPIPFRVFPWVNIDRVTVTFNRSLGPVDPSVLHLRGGNVPVYPAPASVETSYDSDKGIGIAQFRLSQALPADRLVLTLQSGPAGIRDVNGAILDGDGNGVEGGDFNTRLTVLPGDASNGFDYIEAWDLYSVRQGLNTSTTHKGIGNQSYSIISDVNGDGVINVIDLAEVRRRLFTRLPYSQPPLAAAAPAASPLRTRPASRELFSSAPVLP
jgi:hypothetical protein